MAFRGVKKVSTEEDLGRDTSKSMRCLYPPNFENMKQVKKNQAVKNIKRRDLFMGVSLLGISTRCLYLKPNIYMALLLGRDTRDTFLYKSRNIKIERYRESLYESRRSFEHLGISTSPHINLRSKK